MQTSRRRDAWTSRVACASIATLSLLAVSPPASAGSPQSDGTPPGATAHLEDLALDVDPLALTPEMMAFVNERISSHQSRRARLLRLQSAIFDAKDGLGVTYGSTETHSAAGTFAARTGNCLSFTLLFASLARYLGLDTYFVEVDEVTGWSQRGEIGFSHWHMYAEVEVENAKVPVDFLPWTERRYRSTRRISEERVRAHYHNNIGADLVAGGKSEEALPHLQRALELDRGFQPARINLAVAYRRMGKLVEAERLLLAVLAADSKNSVAAANLASLYLEQGNPSEASRWLAKRRAFLARNPFHHFRLGIRAYQAGNFSEARDRFKKAIARQGDEPLFFERLADAQLQLGQQHKARSSLRRALAFTESPERKRLLEERLGQHDLQPPETL